MEELKDVVLNVYSLAPTSDDQQAQQSSGRAGAGFLARLLPSVGMGAYHTEIVLDGYHYTFAANAGIVKTAAVRVPPQASFQESIPLGSCRPPRNEINGIVKKLGDLYFTATAYHLVHRNCNHFTETFATALILHDDLIDNMEKPKKLKSYPEWINRLAGASSMVVSHDEDIVPCQVWLEAAKAVGADEKVGWSLQSKAKTTSKAASKTSNQKKELSEKQKAILAKIRKT